MRRSILQGTKHIMHYGVRRVTDISELACYCYGRPKASVFLLCIGVVFVGLTARAAQSEHW